MRFIRFLKVFSILLIFLSLSLVLSTQKGDVIFRIGQKIIELPLSYLMIGAVLMGGLLLLIYQIWALIWSIPERYHRFLDKKKKQKAHNLMVDGLTSLAAWQPKEAMASTELAEKIMPDNQIITYIAAQSAQLAGDNDRASELYTKMLTNQRMRFIALRGLAMIAKQKKDIPQMMDLINKAFDIRHDSPWVVGEWLNVSARMSYLGLPYTLEKHGISKQMDKVVWNRHLGLISTIRAQKALNVGATHEAKNHLKKALDYRSDLVWCAVELAKIHKSESNLSKAQRVLQNAYEKFPHRDLVAVWDKLNPVDARLEKLRYVEKLVKENSKSYESYIVLAKYAIDCEIWGQSLHYTQQAIQIAETTEAYNLLQRIQVHLPVATLEFNKDPGIDYGWYCHTCGHGHDEWSAACMNCDEIDTVAWSLPVDIKNKVIHNKIDEKQIYLMSIS
jgi:HemY protein